MVSIFTRGNMRLGVITALVLVCSTAAEEYINCTKGDQLACNARVNHTRADCYKLEFTGNVTRTHDGLIVTAGGAAAATTTATVCACRYVRRG